MFGARVVKLNECWQKEKIFLVNAQILEYRFKAHSDSQLCFPQMFFFAKNDFFFFAAEVCRKRSWLQPSEWAFSLTKHTFSIPIDIFVRNLIKKVPNIYKVLKAWPPRYRRSHKVQFKMFILIRWMPMSTGWIHLNFVHF